MIFMYDCSSIDTVNRVRQWIPAVAIVNVFVFIQHTQQQFICQGILVCVKLISALFRIKMIYLSVLVQYPLADFCPGALLAKAWPSCCRRGQ